MGPAGRSTTLIGGSRPCVCALDIVEAHDRIGVGDIELVAHQRHAVRRIQLVGKHEALIRGTRARASPAAG